MDRDELVRLAEAWGILIPGQAATSDAHIREAIARALRLH